jgi:hypothetical protein
VEYALIFNFSPILVESDSSWHVLCNPYQCAESRPPGVQYRVLITIRGQAAAVRTPASASCMGANLLVHSLGSTNVPNQDQKEVNLSVTQSLAKTQKHHPPSHSIASRRYQSLPWQHHAIDMMHQDKRLPKPPVQRAPSLFTSPSRHGGGSLCAKEASRRLIRGDRVAAVTTWRLSTRLQQNHDPGVVATLSTSSYTT